jgi:hypothetical protein
MIVDKGDGNKMSRIICLVVVSILIVGASPSYSLPDSIVRANSFCYVLTTIMAVRFLGWLDRVLRPSLSGAGG